MTPMDMRDKTAIVGIGWTKYSKNSGVSTLTLALEASKNAIEDAGLRVQDIDSVLTFSTGELVSTRSLASHLGLPILRYRLDISGGGDVSQAVVANAATAVATGKANYALVYRAINGASGIRFGDAAHAVERTKSAAGSNNEAQFLQPYGVLAAVHYFAFLCRRHMIQYGTPTPEQLGSFAIACRKWANLNPRAQMYPRPMTMEDYMNSRMIAEPLRLYDCCLTSDGATALIVTTAERAKDLKHRPVYIRAAAEGGGPFTDGEVWTNYGRDHTVSYAHYIAADLWRRAGIGPKDIDVAEIYDCFTYGAINQIEDFGFCKKGEGGAFVEGGRTGPGGEFPVNTHGGLLSEAYIHGLNSTVEAVSQLRGDAGARQVKDAELAIVTGGGTDIFGSALVLRR